MNETSEQTDVQSSDLLGLVTRLRYALDDPDCKLTQSQLTHRVHELRQKAARWDDWCNAQARIEQEMPQGWRFVFDCSPGDWGLSLFDPDGNDVEFDRDHDSVAQAISSAISCARKLAPTPNASLSGPAAQAVENGANDCCPSELLNKGDCNERDGLGRSFATSAIRYFSRHPTRELRNCRQRGRHRAS